MSVKLDIFANVKGTNQVDSLNRGINKLGREATIAATNIGWITYASPLFLNWYWCAFMEYLSATSNLSHSEKWE